MTYMIHLKTEAEIKITKQGGGILSDVMNILLSEMKPGITLKKLDTVAEKEIVARGAFPSFKKVKGYHWTICGCVNDVVVHGIPGEYSIKAGDVISIDCGVYYRGFHTDSAWTIYVKESAAKDFSTASNKADIKAFLQAGEVALGKGLEKVRVGNYIYDISKAVQDTIEKRGYAIVKSLVGHGVGRELHEEPEVPNFVSAPRRETPRITPGMTLAVEVIYAAGTGDVVYKDNDGWTLATKDGKISGLFEATVAITAHGCILLTPIFTC